MSAGHLSREFRMAYGESPYSYLMTRRIERAMALLRRGDLSVTEVCFAVGCRRWARSAPASPSWSGCRRASTCARRPAPPRRCRRAWPSRSPDRSGNRSGIEEARPQRLLACSAMDITIHSSLPPAQRPRRLVAFYRDVLGFELRNDVGYNGMRWLTVGPARPARRQHRALPARRRPRHHRRRAPHASPR